MKRWVLAALMASSAAAITAPAQASHIFTSDVTVNGIALDDGTGGSANPLINVLLGGTLTFAGNMRGAADTLFVSITGIPGASNFSVVFPGTGSGPGAPTLPFSQGFTMNTLGLFGGLVQYDFPVSFPDYLAPNGAQLLEPSFAFRVNVVQGQGGVPEPATWAMMLLGMGAVGWSMRRRRQKVQIRYAF